ncbi:MAG: thioredoxin family protein [Nocardioides sp.]|nr:thioredoxin family protein [Nocardioides sp.]
MTTGVWILLLALAGAAAFGLWRRSRDGRFRAGGSTAESAESGAGAPESGAGAPESGAQPGDPAGASPTAPGGAEPVVAAAELGAPFGERATLLQFSSAFCAPCRATRQVLADVATTVPGVAHVEVDAEEHLDLVRRLGILRTPTTLVLDPQGHELTRAAGAPSRAAVLETLDQHLTAPPAGGEGTDRG